MEIVKTMLMGCGALALLSVVGCVGMVGVGTYAVDQAIEESGGYDAFVEEQNRRSTRPAHSNRQDDPFSEYQPKDYDEDGEQVGGWGDDTK